MLKTHKMIDLAPPPRVLFFLKALTRQKCWAFVCPPVCSVLMGAVRGLGAAKVNYCTGRGFWLHWFIA